MAGGSGAVAAGFSAGRLAGQTDVWFDAAGRAVATVGPQNLGWSFTTTETAYDAAGQVVEQTDGKGAVTETSYDLSGHVIGRVDGNGHTTSYGYDDHGRLSSRAAPGKPAAQVQYVDGDVAASPPVPASKVVTQPDGTVVTSTLDANGQVVGVAASDGSDPISYSL